MRTMKVPNADTKGATVIEFALVAFIFFLIMWGLLEFGRAFYVRNTTEYLTRCMAREAVVRKPSDHELAKQSCLFKVGEFYTWPFYKYETTPSEGITDLFVITYIMKDTPPTTTTNPNPIYDNQLNVCLSDAKHCVSYVKSSVAADTSLGEFGLLRSWLGSSGNITEPDSAVTMPAESMGYAPR